MSSEKNLITAETTQLNSSGFPVMEKNVSYDMNMYEPESYRMYLSQINDLKLKDVYYAHKNKGGYPPMGFIVHELESRDMITKEDASNFFTTDDINYVPELKTEGVVTTKPVTTPAKSGEGLRFNEGKLRYDLMHPIAIQGLVEVLTVGANKYAERNWEKGMAWSKVLASLMRHLFAILRGEDYDPETGKLHADHLQCNAHFLSAYYKIYPQGDDRPHNYLKPVKIGLDIDEVLCNWVGAWCDKDGKPQPTSWKFDRNLLSKFEEMRDSGKLDEFYLSLDPLIKPEDIPFEPTCYITSRPIDSVITEQWLDKHGFPAAPVFTVGVSKTKVDVALEQGIDIFVDDSYDNFVSLNNAGVCCFLMDAPHNQRYNVGFKRIKTLNEIF